MSRVAKWKLEKTKVKVVFRLQFHATHIPLVGWDKLFISFIPSDSGKATAKTTKANVRNGTCKWADPIYETTRLLQNARSKRYDEKLYKLVVAMGSSRASVLGEAIINLADYANAAKPSAVSLPLHGCNSGTILHVTVQLLTSKTGFREFEQQRELRERGLQSGAESKHDNSGPGKEAYVHQLDKVNSIVRPRDAKELSSVEEAGSHEEYADSALGMDDTSSTSESMYAEKHDSCSGHEIDSLKSTVSGNLNGFLHSQSPQAEKGEPSDYQVGVQGSSNFIHGWNSDYSIDNDLPMVYEENHRLRGSLELAETTFSELRVEICTLESQANEIHTETQKLANLLVSEIYSGEEMAKDVSLMKLECSKFKDDIERLKNLSMDFQVFNRDCRIAEHDHPLQNLQLRAINGLLILENRMRELQNKTYLSFHESDLTFVHSQLEELLRIIQSIKQETGEAILVSNVVQSGRIHTETHTSNKDPLSSATELDLDLSLPESLLHRLSIPPLVFPDTESVGTDDAMKRKILDLMRELDEAKVEREKLIKKMDQMECYYEALIQELEDNQKQVLGELQYLRTEHTTCLYTISASKAETESVLEDMAQQLSELAQEKHDLDVLYKELEKRAAISEAALRRAHLNYSIAVKKLQKDLELLSSQVVSMFETNENIIKQAFSESSNTEVAGHVNIFQNAEGDEAANLLECRNPHVGIRRQQFGGDILLEDLKKSLCLQEELYQKVEEELCEMQSTNLHLDIFSKTLQETLLEANVELLYIRANSDKLAQALDLSNVSQDQLIVKLQDDSQALTVCKASCIAKLNDMALRNQALEANLEILTKENGLLVQKVSDFEELVMESKTKYEACCAEKAALSNILKQENLENARMQSEVWNLKEPKLCELGSLKDNLEIVSKENSLLPQKVSDFEGIGMESKAYQYEACSVERAELRNLLRKENPENARMQYEISILKQELETSEPKLVQLASLRDNPEIVTKENSLLSQKVSEFEGILTENITYHRNYEACQAEKAELSNLLKQENLETVQLQSEVSYLREELEISKAKLAALASLRENLQEDMSFMQDKLANILVTFNQQFKGLGLDSGGFEVRDFRGIIFQFEELQHHACKKILELMKEKKRFDLERDSYEVSLSNARSEILSMKQKFRSNIQDLTTKLDVSNARIEKMQFDLEFVANKLDINFEVEDKYTEQTKELLADLALFKVDLQRMTSKTGLLAQEILELKEISKDQEVNNSTIVELEQEKQGLSVSLQDALQESIKLTAERDSMLRSLNNDLQVERTTKEILEGSVRDIASQLEKAQEKLLEYDQQVAEMEHLGHLSRGLEMENSRLNHLLRQSDERLRKHQEESSCLTCLRTELVELDECLLTSDIKFTYLLIQYGILQQEFEQHIKSSDGCFGELWQRHNAVETLLNDCFVSEARCREENTELTIKSDIEASLSQCNADDLTRVRLEECQKKMAALDAVYMELKDQYAVEVDQLKNLLANAGEEIDFLLLSNKELEITMTVLKDKFDEQRASVLMIENNKDEMEMLQSRCNELTLKLSQQVLKTEEFKKLSVHLKELKNRAETDCLIACEKRESEGPPVVQESLRIAFIKEQYETRILELRQQLSISRKHAEEMLFKLQDTINEMEHKKRSEALQSKRSEELSGKLLVLEADLKSALSDNCEKIKAHDELKAELDCAVLSLECCKEEKEKVEASLQQCKEEKNSIVMELTSTKQKLENVAFSRKSQQDESAMTACFRDASILRENVEPSSSNQDSERENSSVSLEKQIVQENSTRGINGINGSTFLNGEMWQPQEEPLEVSETRLNTMDLRSSMEHLQEELERMKSENSLLPKDHQIGPDFRFIQGEIMQLQKANEELRNIFPVLEETASSGNALERVLALEFELAGSLRARIKSNIQFQSSFLKQHSDEAAVLKTFRDINELIKEMLELKGKYVATETELREMHDRYSQLSLQFAEVEGDRQKLKMTLKNVRASRKLISFNRASSAATADQSP